MKLGCFGCLVLIVAILVIVGVVLGGLFLSANIFSAPQTSPVSYSRSDGYAAQQKLFEIVTRQAGRSTRRDPIVLTEAEANAFLARHLEQSGLPLSPISVRFTQGQVAVQGQTPLRQLMKGPPFAQILPYVSDKRLDQPVWVTVQGTIKIEGSGSRRYGRLEVSDFIVGTQHLGSTLLTVLMGPSGGGLLRWPVPAVVTDVRIGDGKVFISTR